MAKRKKALAKGTAVANNVEKSLKSLAIACTDGDRAVGVRSKDAKKFASAVKRLSKRHASLVKRKKTASARNKKSSTGETRQALRAVVRDLAKTKKELAKARAVKKVNGTELKSVKTASRRANAYKKAIDKAEKALNKPAKRRKKRSA